MLSSNILSRQLFQIPVRRTSRFFATDLSTAFVVIYLRISRLCEQDRRWIGPFCQFKDVLNLPFLNLVEALEHEPAIPHGLVEYRGYLAQHHFARLKVFKVSEDA